METENPIEICHLLKEFKKPIPKLISLRSTLLILNKILICTITLIEIILLFCYYLSNIKNVISSISHIKTTVGY